MALDQYWTAERQFKKDRGSQNDFGLAEAIFVAVGISGAELEITCDLDLHNLTEGVMALKGPSVEDCLKGRPVRQADTGIPKVLLGAQFLCPRCQMPCYVPTAQHPNPHTEPREIIIHWDKPYTAEDGIPRPTITISGAPLKCDYLTSEITGIANPGRCGWVGIIENGRGYDHTLVKGAVLKR